MTRLEYFIEADRNIEEINASETSFTLAHNKFSDWSKDEYKQLLGVKPEMDLPKNTLTSMSVTLMSTSTGRPKVPSPPSRTKALVAHAGLFQQLVLSRAFTRSLLASCSLSLSSSSLTVPR